VINSCETVAFRSCRCRFLIPEIASYPSPDTAKLSTTSVPLLSSFWRRPSHVHSSAQEFNTKSTSGCYDKTTRYHLFSHVYNSYLVAPGLISKCRLYIIISHKSKNISHSNHQNGTENTKLRFYVLE
jgi:hypothetical protein